MKQLSKIKRLNLRDVWPKEANDFTPWLAENIEELGEALGIDLELEAKEASVGDFSLDLLAKDLGTNRMVVVENQLTQTDHDHLGKLLTYAAGFGASVVIWVAASIREEHRQALEWLNQRTDTDTEFFGVVVEVLQIDDSKPAYNFKPIVFPNEWQKSKRSQAAGSVSSKGEAYRQYYQPLIDELREKHKFTGARVAQPQNWYAFSSGVSGINVSVVFSGKDTARVELYIDLRDFEANKTLFDWLHDQKDAIEKKCGFPLQWERLDEKRASRIAVSRSGSIESSAEDLEQIRKWQIERLLIFKKVFGQLVKDGVKKLNV
ncbi:MAG: DUF4268 domain-containing protein [Nitrosomonas sp.]|nr:DUF4268 domain-containing protein [Nitrosomonas sp.]